MSTALTQLQADLQFQIGADPFWRGYLASGDLVSGLKYALHLVVMREPFLKYLLDGSKSVESRFSQHRIAPYGRVGTGDVLLLKRNGGPIMGICRVQSAWFYVLRGPS